MAVIALLGAGGFIGSNFIPYLKAKGHIVHAVDIDFDSHWSIRGELYRKADKMLPLDLRDARDAARAVRGADMVIHLASDMGGVGYFSAHDYYPYINNMRIDMNVLEACELEGIKRLFYSSSACIYPIQLQQNPIYVPILCEDMIYPANSDLSYGWEKLMMLRLCERAPFDARVGIFHTIYGPYQEIEGERMKFPTAMVTKALEAEKSGEIEIWGNGLQKRTFLYIDDALDKIYTILMSSGYDGPVNVGSSEVVSVNDVMATVFRHLGINPTVKYNENKPSGVLARGCSNTKYNQFYERPKHETSVEVGFGKLIDWLVARKTCL